METTNTTTKGNTMTTLRTSTIEGLQIIARTGNVTLALEADVRDAFNALRDDGYGVAEADAELDSLSADLDDADFLGMADNGSMAVYRQWDGGLVIVADVHGPWAVDVGFFTR